MQKDKNLKITDWIKMYSSVTKVADELCLSRPTVYKYIEAYDKGDKSFIPDNVIAYFDQKILSSDSTTSLKVKYELKEEIMAQKKRADELDRRISEMMISSAELEKRLFELKVSNTKTREASILEEKLLEKKRLTQKYSLEYNRLQEIISHLSMELAQYEEINSLPPFALNKLYGIQSECYSDNKKCMIIYDGEQCDDTIYRLNLYAKLNSDYIRLKKYDDVSCWNYFIIDDVVLSAPLYYEINRCSLGHDEHGDIDYIPERNQTTGMCKLNPKK